MKDGREGLTRRVDLVRLPKASYGSCLNFLNCGNTEIVLRQRNELLGNGYCMKCYDKGVDTRTARLTKSEILERKKEVLLLLSKGVYYKEIAKELGILPSTMWTYIKRMETNGEVAIKQPMVKVKGVGGRKPSRIKVLSFTKTLERMNKRKAAVGDKVKLEYKNTSCGQLAKDHNGHESTILKAEYRTVKYSLTTRFMYFIQCTDCKNSKPGWAFSRVFEKI